MPMFGKKDEPAGAAAADDEAVDLQELTGRLGQLGDLLAEAEKRIAAYLLRRESQTAAHDEQFASVLGAELTALGDKIDRLREAPESAGAASGTAPEAAPAGPGVGQLAEKLDRIQQALEAVGDGSAPATGSAAPGPLLAEMLDTVGRQTEGLSDGLRALREQVEAGFRQLAELLLPDEETVAESGAPGEAEWLRALLGPELADHPAMGFQGRQLVEGILEGRPGPCGIAGQLLVFRSAPPEKLPQLLKEIGEAFYRWIPKTAAGANPIEEALVAELHKRCEASGINNTIELVHPGERFDSARHSATSRGVEITQVHGWIVLRDNGRVYTKANVSVR